MAFVRYFEMESGSAGIVQGKCALAVVTSNRSGERAGKTALVKQIHGINDNIVRTIQRVAPYFEDFILRPNPPKPDSIRLEWKDKYCRKPPGQSVYFLSSGF